MAAETPPADTVAQRASAPQSAPRPTPQSAARTAAQTLLDRRPKSRPQRVLTPEMVERLIHTTLRVKRK